VADHSTDIGRACEHVLEVDVKDTLDGWRSFKKVPSMLFGFLVDPDV
jgi:hypothetical protein